MRLRIGSKGTRPHGWRRLAVATWKSPNDPQVYGSLELDATGVLAFIGNARAAGLHVTATHLVGRGVAHALREAPELNARLQGGRFVRRPSVDVFFITAVGSGEGLSGVRIDGAHEKSAVEIARELDAGALALRCGKDSTFSRTQRLADALPMPLLRVAMRAVSWAVGEHAWSIPAISLRASPFGSAMVTSVGMFGLPAGFAPISWMYHVPLLVLVGEIVDRPVAVDGRVAVRSVLPLSVTFDHRYLDGAHVARLLKAFKSYVATPESYEPAMVEVMGPGNGGIRAGVG